MTILGPKQVAVAKRALVAAFDLGTRKETRSIGRTVEQERAAFERIMESSTAKLMDFSKPYVGRLCNRDRGELLGNAIDFMWGWRKTHNPKEESLLQFWDRCLRAAALLRATWQVSRFDGWTTVRGEHLGAQGA